MTYRAPLADYYARRYGAIIVQASGNTNPNSGAFCDGFNTLCVGGTRLQSRFPWSLSDWSPDPETGTEDPGIQTASGTFRALRLHKPDVVAPSRDLNVPAFEPVYDPTHTGIQNYPDHSDTSNNVFQDYWQVEGGQGSSFAAPVVTGLIAQALNSHGSHLTGAEVRAVINAGSTWQPRIPNLDPSACQPGPTSAYPASRSTSASPPDSQNCDYTSGVGPLSPWALLLGGIQVFNSFCPGSGGGTGGGGGSPPPCPFGDACNPEATFRGRAVVTPDVHHITGLPLEALPSDPTRRIRRLSGPRPGGPDGFAVRAAVSFDRCVADQPSVLIEGFAAGLTREDRDYRPLIDFDLAVFAWNQGDAVETELLRVGSPDETNEVIWYSTLQSWDFYEVVVVEPANYTLCPSSFNYRNETGEALGWAEVHFRQAISPINGP